MSGAPAWAVKGARCICVVDNWSGPDKYPWIAPPPFAPAYGAQLTILAVVGSFLLFEELPTTYATPVGEGYVTWPADAFRPLVTRSIEQDLAIFRPILDQVREHDPA